MTETHDSTLADVSRAMVALHKEQFGRGPTKARTHLAGPDAMITILEDALLPAEKAMVAMGESLRVEESRSFMQTATQDRFVRTVEEIVYRTVRSFQSACDPQTGIITEIMIFEPHASDGEATAE
jgi:uncharacterized protein YbcI